MYNEETLNKWNMTEEDCEKAIRKISIKGMRLTHDEKAELLFFFEEGIISRDDLDAQISHIEFGRKLAKEFEEDKKLVKDFVKEWRRLKVKYDGLNSDLQDKSLDELTDMWITDYFELYFMEDKFDLIKYHGAKEYAQLYCYNVGICPSEEVSIWEE